MPSAETTIILPAGLSIFRFILWKILLAHMEYSSRKVKAKKYLKSSGMHVLKIREFHVLETCLPYYDAFHIFR